MAGGKTAAIIAKNTASSNNEFPQNVRRPKTIIADADAADTAHVIFFTFLSIFGIFVTILVMLHQV
jgi:hypothetical protein